MNRIVFFLFVLMPFLNATVEVKGQKSLLHAGPMAGYSEMQEVMLWVQTTKAASVRIEYYDREEPSVKFRTENAITKEEYAFTAKLLANEVEPGRIYDYDLYINTIKVDLPYETSFQTLPLWKWRSDPPRFSFALGSCAYINEERYDRPGEPYGGEYHIYHSLLKNDPDFMIWLGDNVYLREPDWNTWTGITHRYTHDRALPALQPLLGSVHHYAIWDDHDYGPNNSDRAWWNKELTMDAFELFWANPSFGVAGNIDGAITFFQWGDADFYLLDNRYYRSPNKLPGEDKTILGQKQLQWLLDGLVSTYSRYKFVVMGGQFLNTEAKHETYINNGFAREREKIISFIHENDIEHVIFLTGDRHYTELSMLEEPGEPVIYDLTVSPLNAGSFSKASEVDNSLHVEGTLVTVRNYGIVSLKGASDERLVDIRVFNSDGELLWDYQIKDF
jgi:alkaline phosphatase D